MICTNFLILFFFSFFFLMVLFAAPKLDFIKCKITYFFFYCLCFGESYLTKITFLRKECDNTMQSKGKLLQHTEDNFKNEFYAPEFKHF